eukprot:gb/GECH01011726.1/.p1 GENE.gb/GECH01011726.1/~~gb/GECH01011726.1/.p1  ORF type:complete len:617 (+),score=21.43 gb/GECH01011726.1/:1-1851(+)
MKLNTIQVLLIYFLLIFSFSVSSIQGTSLNHNHRNLDVNHHFNVTDPKSSKTVTLGKNNNTLLRVDPQNSLQDVSGSCPCNFAKSCSIDPGSQRTFASINVDYSCFSGNYSTKYIGKLYSIEPSRQVWQGSTSKGKHKFDISSVKSGFYKFEMSPQSGSYQCEAYLEYVAKNSLSYHNVQPHSVELDFDISTIADSYHAHIAYQKYHTSDERNNYPVHNSTIELHSTSPTLDNLMPEYSYRVVVTASLKIPGVRIMTAETSPVKFITPPTWKTLHWVSLTSLIYHSTCFVFTLAWIIGLGVMKKYIPREYFPENLISILNLGLSDLVIGGLIINAAFIIYNSIKISVSYCSWSSLEPVPFFFVSTLIYFHSLALKAKKPWEKVLSEITGFIFAFFGFFFVFHFSLTHLLGFFILNLFVIGGLFFSYYHNHLIGKNDSSTGPSETQSFIENSSSPDDQPKLQETDQNVDWEKVNFIMCLPQFIITIIFSFVNIFSQVCPRVGHNCHDKTCMSNSFRHFGVIPLILCFLIFVADSFGRIVLWIREKQFPEKISKSSLPLNQFLMAVSFYAYLGERIIEQSFTNMMQMIGIHLVFILIPQITILAIVVFTVVKNKKLYP